MVRQRIRWFVETHQQSTKLDRVKLAWSRCKWYVVAAVALAIDPYTMVAWAAQVVQYIEWVE